MSSIVRSQRGAWWSRPWSSSMVSCLRGRAHSSLVSCVVVEVRDCVHTCLRFVRPALGSVLEVHQQDGKTYITSWSAQLRLEGSCLRLSLMAHSSILILTAFRETYRPCLLRCRSALVPLWWRCGIVYLLPALDLRQVVVQLASRGEPLGRLWTREQRIMSVPPVMAHRPLTDRWTSLVDAVFFLLLCHRGWMCGCYILTTGG